MVTKRLHRQRDVNKDAQSKNVYKNLTIANFQDGPSDPHLLVSTPLHNWSAGRTVTRFSNEWNKMRMTIWIQG